MVAKIKDTEVAGVVTSDGRCPSCSTTLIVQDRGYKFIKKNQGIAKLDNGEDYVKCPRCGRFVMLLKRAA